MKLRLEDCNDELRKRIRAAIDRDDSNKDANMEHGSEHGKEGDTKKPKARSVPSKKHDKDPSAYCISEPVRIRITHYRHKLADSDGYAIKWLIDSLVRSGIIPDDDHRWIPKRPDEEEEVIPKEEPEKTVVEIFKAESNQEGR